jgi:hypothetical protein
VKGQKVIAFMALGIVVIVLIAILAASTVGAPPTVPPDPTATPRVAR